MTSAISSCPESSLVRVVLPAPFRPTSPTRMPESRRRFASWSSSRAPMRTETSWAVIIRPQSREKTQSRAPRRARPAGAPTSLRPLRPQIPEIFLTGTVSDVEADGAQLLAAGVGDLVRAPWRHPDPVDALAGDQALQGLRGLILDDVGQRAGRGRQRHVDDCLVVLVHRDAVDEAEVDDVDAQLGVDHVA